MKLQRSGILLSAVAGALMLGNAASAASISGQFNLNGTLQVTDTTINFDLKSGSFMPGDQLAAVNLPATGSFSGLAALDIVNIQDLNTATDTPGNTPFPTPHTNWITLDNGVNINLDLTEIPIDTSIAACVGGQSYAAGDQCRANNGPIILQQTATGVTALLGLIGDAHAAGATSPLSPMVGKLAANFTVGGENTIESLLTTFASQGFITTGYQANFSVTPTSPIPEPSSFALLGAGLLGLGFWGRKKATR